MFVFGGFGLDGLWFYGVCVCCVFWVVRFAGIWLLILVLLLGGLPWSLFAGVSGFVL